MKLQAKQQAFRIALIYVIVAGCWHLLSNALLKRHGGSLDESLDIDTIKDWGFVILTAGLLHQVLRRVLRKWEREMELRKVSENDLRRTERALKTISACNGVLVRAKSEAMLLTEICRVVVEKGGYRMAWVGFSENDEEKSVTIAARAGHEDGYLNKSNFSWSEDVERGRGPVGIAIRTGEIVVCNDFLTSPQTRPWRQAAIQHGFASNIVLPLRHAEKSFGVLTIYAAEANAFNFAEVELLQELADDLGYGIQALRIQVEHQQAEKEHQLFRALIERSSDGIHVVDPFSGRFLDVNETACRSLGYTRQELLSLATFDVGIGLDAAIFQATNAEMKKTGHATLEIVQRRKDGTAYPVELSLSLVTFDREYLLAIARDITRRKQAEATLRESEKKFSVIFRSSPVPVSLSTIQEGRYLDGNDEFLKLLQRSREEVIGHTSFELNVWADLEQRAVMVAKLESHESVRNVELEIHTKSGELRSILWSAEAVVIGGESCWLGSALDITERKQTERLLEFVAQEGWSRPQENYLARLVEYIGELLAVDYVFIGRCKDDQTVQTTGLYARGKIVPDREYSTRGAPCHNVIGKTLCHYGEQLQEMFSEDTLLAEMGAQSYLGIPLADSAGRPLGLMALLDTKPMPDAQFATAVLQIAAVRVAGEIERRAKVEELHWKTALMEAHMEAAPDGILMIDNRGRKISQNRRMNELLKIPPHIYEAEDATVQVKFVASRAKNSRQFVEKIAYLYTHPEEVSRDEVEFLDGTIVDRYSSPVRDKAGRSCGRIWTFRDLTQARQLEAQLRQSQKMEAIGQLAGGVAHDFNNILAALLMQTQLVEMVEHLPPEVVDGLEQIRAFTNRASDLTRQLLLFSRRQIMQPCNLDLNEVVTNLAKMLQRIIGEDVRLQLNLHPAPLMTRADAGMIEQVLMNLAVNARDAMPKGGQLRIDTTEINVAENAAGPEVAPGHYVCFSISDTGSGIPLEVLPKIFEPFFTTKEAGKGTGLGLATVFGIVKQHQGWITVDNRPGQGVTFQVYLPVSTLTVAETPKMFSKPRPRGGNETILLVEDESEVRNLIRTILKRNGYQVLEAANGVEALHLWQAQRETVALLVTDLVMPAGLSGHELAWQLQAGKPSLKVIFISGYSAEIAGQELQLHDGENFIQKPFAADHLLETVRRSLDG